MVRCMRRTYMASVGRSPAAYAANTSPEWRRLARYRPSAVAPGTSPSTLRTARAKGSAWSYRVSSMSNRIASMRPL